MPAVGRFDGGAIFLAGERRLLFAGQFGVVEELEKQDPGEQGQTVEVAVQSLVLAHEVAGRFDEGGQARAVVRGAASAFLRAMARPWGRRSF